MLEFVVDLGGLLASNSYYLYLDVVVLGCRWWRLIVPMVEHDLCLCVAYMRCKYIEWGLFYLIHRLQLFQQSGFSFWPNTLDVVQFGMQGVLAALVSVEADGISMHLILYAREHVE